MQLDPQPSAFRSWKVSPRLTKLAAARTLPDPPSWAHDSRSRGRKAKGRVWERRFSKLLSKTLNTSSISSTMFQRRGQWFAYCEDGSDDVRYAQADFILMDNYRGLVVETKTTRTPDGVVQLLALYQPIVRFIWPQLDWSFCQAFKYWAGPKFEGAPIFTSLPWAIHQAFEEPYAYADLHLGG